MRTSTGLTSAITYIYVVILNTDCFRELEYVWVRVREFVCVCVCVCVIYSWCYTIMYIDENVIVF
jgi:hypothetical protein